MRIPIEVKNSFQHSDSLNAHIERRLDSALGPHAQHIQRVDLRLLDANGPKGGSDDKVARIAVTIAPAGRIVATASASDVYVSVNRAAARARAAVARYITRLKRRARYPAGRTAS
jgi:putative sigma-54 modulation protein